MTDAYLITGGAGNLACQLTFHLAEPEIRVLLFDVAERPVAEVAEGCEYLRGDIAWASDLSTVIDDFKPTAILHFASLLSGQSEEDRALAWEVNMNGAFRLFESAIKSGVKKVFFPSSLASYGGELPSPLPEDFPQWPTGFYGMTKAAVERLGVYYHSKHGLDFRCIRLAAVVSAFAPAGAASAYASRAFAETVRAGRFTFKMRPETRMPIIYVKDVLGALVDFLGSPSEHLTRRIYNVFAMSPSAMDIAEAIVARVPGAQIEFDPDLDLVRLIESWPSEIADASARRDWGWQPRYDLQTMADDFIENVRLCATSTSL